MALVGMEWLVVAGIVVIVFFFGKEKVISWARTIGEAKKAFKEASKEEESTPEDKKE